VPDQPSRRDTEGIKLGDSPAKNGLSGLGRGYVETNESGVA